WEIVPVLHLRIIGDDLWDRVKARQESLAFIVRRNSNGIALNRAHRTKYLLSGLIRCGTCGSAYVGQGNSRFACSRHRRGGPCDNSGWIDGHALELRVLAGIKEKLLAPELVAAFIEEFERELASARNGARKAASGLRAQLQNCERQIANVTAVIADGRSNPALLKRLDQLESEQAGLQLELSRFPSPSAAEVIHLPTSGEIYRQKVQALESALE